MITVGGAATALLTCLAISCGGQSSQPPAPSTRPAAAASCTGKTLHAATPVTVAQDGSTGLNLLSLSQALSGPLLVMWSDDASTSPPTVYASAVVDDGDSHLRVTATSAVGALQLAPLSGGRALVGGRAAGESSALVVSVAASGDLSTSLPVLLPDSIPLVGNACFVSNGDLVLAVGNRRSRNGSQLAPATNPQESPSQQPAIVLQVTDGTVRVSPPFVIPIGSQPLDGSTAIDDTDAFTLITPEPPSDFSLGHIGAEGLSRSSVTVTTGVAGRMPDYGLATYAVETPAGLALIWETADTSSFHVLLVDADGTVLRDGSPCATPPTDPG